MTCKKSQKIEPLSRRWTFAQKSPHSWAKVYNHVEKIHISTKTHDWTETELKQYLGIFDASLADFQALKISNDFDNTHLGLKDHKWLSCDEGVRIVNRKSIILPVLLQFIKYSACVAFLCPYK